MASSLLDTVTASSLLDQKPEGAIYIMRHGRTALDTEHRSDGWLDMPLSDDGQRELIDSQQYLKSVPITKIYTPDLKRTTETADLMKSGILEDPKIVVDDDLKTWNLGELAGTKKSFGRPKVQALIANPGTSAPRGESYNDFVGRFMPWFDKRVKEMQSGKTVLIVCSGSNLRCLGGRLLGDEDAVDLDEGGLARLQQFNGQWYGVVIDGGQGDGDYVS